MKEGIVRIRNARKNSDWPMIQDEFANVNKLVEKSKMLIIQSGLPPFYIKMLAEVEDHVQLALKDKEAIKKMKPVVSRALNQMKLQVRKHNEVYKAEIADCRANPEKTRRSRRRRAAVARARAVLIPIPTIRIPIPTPLPSLRSQRRPPPRRPPRSLLPR
jgi:hypothetical protein